MSDLGIKKDFFQIWSKREIWYYYTVQLIQTTKVVSTIPGATATILTFALLLLAFPKVRIFSVGIWLGLNDSDL